METLYYEDDDILVLKLSDNPITREVSQDWNVNISYDAEGNIVEMVILDARESGLFPVHTQESKVA
jgi:YD repeat-containing protein